MFGLAYKDDPANIKNFLDEAGDPYARVGADRKGRIAIDWGVYGVPETFIVKGDGTDRLSLCRADERGELSRHHFARDRESAAMKPLCRSAPYACSAWSVCL